MNQNSTAAQTAAQKKLPTIFELRKLTGKPVKFESPIPSMCYFKNGKHTVQIVGGGIVEKVENFGRSAEVKIKDGDYSYYVEVYEGQGISILVKN
ncbi:MAG: hypothetical protein KBD48_01625 [Candidatus Pacebacteria bacterium]|nr:hypothetical protein [Candidatus Paceibacterota bacterium]MBP9715873.1 hypothetical protein [Candidatus Paceibacterota bacterium]